MKRAYFLFLFLAVITVINVYGFGGGEKTPAVDNNFADILTLNDKIDELEKEQKKLKDESTKNKRDMEALVRKLASVFPDAGFDEIFYDDNSGYASSVSNNNSRTANSSNVDASGTGDFPEIPQNIILAQNQNSYLTQEAVIDYFVKYSRPPSWFGKGDIESLVETYFNEARNERVNPDIALAQVWYATQSLTHYGILSSYNYANLEPVKEVEGVNDWDGNFSNSETGVRAHIQHLKGYASSDRPANIVDPRYEILVMRDYLGKGETISKLCAMWTKDTTGRYENSLTEILRSLYQHQNAFSKL